MFFERNICQFIPQAESGYTLIPLHFVLETKAPRENTEVLSVFRIHYVLEGSATLITSKGEYQLSEGSVFFCLPAKKYTLKAQKGFLYSYVSYFGSRASQLAEKIKLSESNCVFPNLSSLKILWSNALPVANKVTDLRAESVLLYTFSTIWESVNKDTPKDYKTNVAVEAKKYADTHFSDPDLTLSRVCEILSYSAKYTSSMFVKHYQTGFSTYVNLIRIQHACSLFEQGYTSIKTVAFMCGFDDPLYFSKTFKSIKGLSPKAYVKDFFEKKNKKQ